MKKLHLIAAALGLLVTTAAVSVASYAATTTTTFPVQDRFSEKRVVHQAIDDGNYDSWKTAMEENVVAIRKHADEMQSSINQETFNKLVSIHQLIEDGKFEEAKALREDLGFIGFGGPGPHMRGMMRHAPPVGQN